MELPFEFFCWFALRSRFNVSLVLCSCFLMVFSRFSIRRAEFRLWDWFLLIVSWALAIALAVEAVMLVVSSDLHFALRLSAAEASLSFSL